MLTGENNTMNPQISITQLQPLSISFFCFWPHCAACRILVLRLGIKPMPPALWAWSLIPWTAREFPQYLVLSIHPLIYIYTYIYIYIFEYFKADFRQQVISAVIFHLHCDEFSLTLHPGLKTLWGVPPGLASALGHGLPVVPFHSPGDQCPRPPHVCSFLPGLCL